MICALSSGCFVSYEASIETACVPFAELSTHRLEMLDTVMGGMQRAGTRIVGVHAPCPNRGYGLDLGAPPSSWERTKQALLETGSIAAAAGASYVVGHAFYCVNGGLPADDAERMQALRAIHAGGLPMSQYVHSRPYIEAKFRTVHNLASLLPTWRRRYPKLQLVLENLNPRQGYGGIVFQDIVDIAEALDGEVGACLDVGHLLLAEAALGCEMRDSIAEAGNLIRVAHVHQNFNGRFCVDRHWNEIEARNGLQDVDTHLPLDVPMWRPHRPEPFRVGAENGAFSSILEGAVQFSRPETGGEAVMGTVPMDALMRLIPKDAVYVFEVDSRYVPLETVLDSYRRFALSLGDLSRQK
jgi:sugar phosphate isomerase/epimerase